MFARDTGAEERLLYLVPDGDESEDDGTEPKGRPGRKIIPFAPALARALKARAAAILATALVIAGFIMPQAASHASVAITIDTDVLFGSVNTWIATFLPIFAIGLGIAIAPGDHRHCRRLDPHGAAARSPVTTRPATARPPEGGDPKCSVESGAF